MERLIADLMHFADVPGLSFFSVREEAEYLGAFGVRGGASTGPADSHTSFEAASLTKPVVAYAVARLADEKKLDLDEPLSRHIGPLVQDDPVLTAITARHVLSHTTGLPNWASSKVPLRSHFPPGSRFSYSGEGFVYLQRALERITGERLDMLVERLVLDPLGMMDSSLVWRASFDMNHAWPHEKTRPLDRKYKPDKANAASSLHTTAADYGRFVIAVLRGDQLSTDMARSWMSPVIYCPKGRTQVLVETAPETEADVAWGLGWGLEPNAGTFFHWGANPGFRAFVMGSAQEQAGFAVFMNSDAGLDIVPAIAQLILPGEHPAFAWLGLADRP